MSAADACPCGTGRPLADCCGPYLDGTALPPTAEALMRSRYSAYALAKVDYIKDTHDVPPGDEIDHDLTARWARESEWLGLEILSTVEEGDTGLIEFRARYRAEGAERVHHERASFHRKDGRWFFVDGTPVKPVPVRAEAKAGRNDPCPCGSGKKFKRCHGA